VKPQLTEQDGPFDRTPEFDPRHMRLTGIAVLERGLPPLPERLTYLMSIPVAYWTATRCAVVLFLNFRLIDGEWHTLATMATFTRDGGTWASPKYWGGTGWSHDPIANPGDLRDLDGNAMVTGGGSHSDTPTPGTPAVIIHGRVAPTVTEIGLIQDGHEDRRPLESHLGAWVVCTEQPSPFRVTAYDQSGVMLADIEES
jgi:hypothetical protein